VQHPRGVPAGRNPVGDRPLEEQTALSGRGETIRRQRIRRDLRHDLRALPGAACAPEFARFRRHAAAGPQTLRGFPGDAGLLSGPLPLSPDRRIPGHQRRAVHHRQAADRRPLQPLRGR